MGLPIPEYLSSQNLEHFPVLRQNRSPLLQMVDALLLIKNKLRPFLSGHLTEHLPVAMQKVLPDPQESPKDFIPNPSPSTSSPSQLFEHFPVFKQNISDGFSHLVFEAIAFLWGRLRLHTLEHLPVSKQYVSPCLHFDICCCRLV